ncbi:MAG: URC4/urg3 family protein [Anderseniella sp.]|nr:URC4/urg3 family protein [Anderseniella sp.]
MTSTEAETARWLLTPEAVRAQSRALLEAGLDGKLAHFTVHPEKLPAAADLVCDVIRTNYPSLDVPPHARWRHFVFDGEDRWAAHADASLGDPQERARTECELAIISVLLDAGAGPAWRYQDARTGQTYARSEGLALASLDMFMAGAFAPGRLAAFDAGLLASGFQVTADNPLEGLEGRAALIARLGQAVASNPDLFEGARLGRIADHLQAQAHGGKLAARTILITLLEALGPIWPGRQQMAGLNLGDTWPHPHAPQGLVPFHKLSQWLSYSLFEPMQRLGLEITGQDALTGLAEYRNGGLFIDTGVIALRDPVESERPQQPSSELVVEWRALTVALLDEVAKLVRERLGKTDAQLPLASVLEGGTWAAGRRIASQLRSGGAPPIVIVSDGSVF